MVTMNLLDANTEIKSFNDVWNIESSITEFNGRLQCFYDLLTRDDANTTTPGGSFDTPTGITTEGAYGLAYVLDDCKTIIRKLFDGYFEVKNYPKQTMEESSPEEKQTQTATTTAAPAAKNNLPSDVSNELFHHAGELSEAVNILTIIEDHHFTKLDSPMPCDEEIERIGNLIKLATTKIILTRDSLEKMIGDSGPRQFGLTGQSAI